MENRVEMSSVITKNGVPSPEILILKLETDNDNLKKRVLELENRLSGYTNNDRHKKYYEQNKVQIKEKANNYLKTLAQTNPEKLKEYRHRAYLKQKEKHIEASRNCEASR